MQYILSREANISIIETENMGMLDLDLYFSLNEKYNKESQEKIKNI